jgi:hypothetical protein
LNETEKADRVKVTKKIAGMYWQDALEKYKEIEGKRRPEFNNIAKTMFDAGQCLLIAIHLRTKLFVISKTKILEHYKVRYYYCHNMLTMAHGQMLIRIHPFPQQNQTTDEMVAFLQKLLGLIETGALEKAKSEEERSNIKKYVKKTQSLHSRFKDDIINMVGYPDNVPENHTDYTKYYTPNYPGIKHIYNNKTIAIKQSNQQNANIMLDAGVACDDNNDGYRRSAVNNKKTKELKRCKERSIK